MVQNGLNVSGKVVIIFLKSQIFLKTKGDTSSKPLYKIIARGEGGGLGECDKFLGKIFDPLFGLFFFEEQEIYAMRSRVIKLDKILKT